MQNLGRLQTTGLSLELFHVQTNTSFELVPNFPVIRIGKPNETINPDIDVSTLPDADIVSRIHAEIQVEGNIYYLQDAGSSNGTYLNNIRLEPKTRYPLNLGDKIDLGQGEKVTFVFQSKQQNQANIISISNPTVFQPQSAENNKPIKVDRTSKLVGLVLMGVGIFFLTANTQVGILVRIPGILLLIAGFVALMMPRINNIIAWILIGLGIAVMAFTSNAFLSTNLLIILVSSALLFVGYQLFNTGKVWKYDLRSLQEIIKQKRN